MTERRRIFGNTGEPPKAPWWSPFRCLSFSRSYHGPRAGITDRCELYIWHPITHRYRDERGYTMIAAHSHGNSGW